MNIRAFVETDEEGVVALWQACDLTRPWNDPREDIARKLVIQRGLFLVAELAGKVIGSVMGGYDGHRGWVNYLAVHPEHRRKGFGEALMRELEARLSALGCPKLNLQIRSANASAKGFYEALGYRQDEVVSYGRRLESDKTFI